MLVPENAPGFRHNVFLSKGANAYLRINSKHQLNGSNLKPTHTFDCQFHLELKAISYYPKPG
jgi:hypothetical protein